MREASRSLWLLSKTPCMKESQNYRPKTNLKNPTNNWLPFKTKISFSHNKSINSADKMNFSLNKTMKLNKGFMNANYKSKSLKSSLWKSAWTIPISLHKYKRKTPLLKLSKRKWFKWFIYIKSNWSNSMIKFAITKIKSHFPQIFKKNSYKKINSKKKKSKILLFHLPMKGKNFKKLSTKSNSS